MTLTAVRPEIAVAASRDASAVRNGGLDALRAALLVVLHLTAITYGGAGGGLSERPSCTLGPLPIWDGVSQRAQAVGGDMIHPVDSEGGWS
jgi:hypothetical protein